MRTPSLLALAAAFAASAGAQTSPFTPVDTNFSEIGRAHV